jgi:hypothetical protein
LDGAGGKDWGNLGKINLKKNLFINSFILDGMFKQMGSGLGGGSASDLNDLEGEETDSDDEPMPDLEDVPKSTHEETK